MVKNEESSLYEGLDPDEIEELMEVRRRYAKLTGIADLASNNDNPNKKNTPKQATDISSSKSIDHIQASTSTSSSSSSCDCKSLQEISLENEELRRKVKELQIKLVS
jgi:hypothetical protein